jgi:hypothetical protein
MTRLWSLIRSATLADVSMVLALLMLGAALLHPTWSARAFRARLASAIADVDALAAAARTNRELRERWPTAAAPATVPPELGGLEGPEGPFSRVAYALEWTTWEVVDSVPAPPDPGPPPGPGDPPRATAGPRMQPVTRAIGAIAVHSGEEPLLAELLEHYGSEAAFVVDTVWVLVLPERTAAPGS